MNPFLLLLFSPSLPPFLLSRESLERGRNAAEKRKKELKRELKGRKEGRKEEKKLRTSNFEAEF